MKYDRDVVRSIVENLALIESTRDIVEELDGELMEALGKVAEVHVRNEFTSISDESDFDMCKKSKVEFTTDDWATDEGVIAGYRIGEWGGESHYWSSSLMGADHDSSMYIHFYVNHNKIGLNKESFRKELKGWVNEYSNLVESGLTMGENNDVLELTFHLDPQNVIEDYPKFDACFVPMQEAINRILTHHANFCDFVASIRKDTA
jgi:hypothetical protein